MARPSKPFDKAGQKVSIGDFVIYTVLGDHVSRPMRFGKVTKVLPNGKVSILGAKKTWRGKLELLPIRAFDRVGERVLKLQPASVPSNYKSILS